MGKPWLEGFKFATYLAVPIALTVTFAFNPDNLNGIIRNVRRTKTRFVRVGRDATRMMRDAHTRTSTDDARIDDLGSRRSARTWCTRRRARSRRSRSESWTRT